MTLPGRGLAIHTIGRQPQTFKPHEGRLLEVMEPNLVAARGGQAQVSLPWLLTKKTIKDPNGHPITGSAEHYVLYDRFHENALRKIDLVPELQGRINCQCAEQLFNGMCKNNS